MKNCRKEKGFSLIEILLVLGIIVALSVIAFVTYEKLSSSRQTTQIMENTNLIAAKGRELTANPSIYTDEEDLQYNKFIVSCSHDEKSVLRNTILKKFMRIIYKTTLNMILELKLQKIIIQ